jgi:hypothetical protein
VTATDPDVFMADLLTRQPALSRLLAISQAADLLRQPGVTIRDLGAAYDRANTTREGAKP